MIKIQHCVIRPLVLAVSLSSSVAFATDYYQDAKKYYDQDDKSAAVIQLKNLLKDSPKHQQGRALLGEIMLEQGQYEAAEKELRQAISLGASKEHVLPLLVRSQLMLRKMSAALETIENRWDESLIPSQRWHMLGRVYIGLQQLTNAENAFYQSLQSKKNPESTYGLALVARLRGSMEEALGTLEPVINEPKIRLDALSLKADIMLELRKGKEAVEILDTLISENENSTGFFLPRARGHVLLNQFDEAKKDISALPAEVQESPRGQLLLALISMGEKRFDDAYRHASAILQTLPNSPRAMLIAGSARYMTQDLQTALSHLKEYVALVPQDPNGRRLLGATQQNLQQSAAALETLEPLLNQVEIDPRAAAVAGYAYISLGDWERGQQLLAIALEKQPDLSRIQNQLLLSQIMTGKGDAAIQSIEASEENNYQSDSLKVIAYIQQQKFDDARAFVNQRIKETPETPSYRILEAMLNIRLGEFDKARQSYQHALEIDPEFLPALLSLARLETQQKNYQEAGKRYQQALAIDNNHLTALLGSAQIAEQQGDERTMLDWLEKARQQHPDSIHPVSSFVRYHLKKRDLKKARKEAHAFHIDHPDMAEGTMLYISTLKASKKFSEAEKLVDKLLKTYPGRDAYARVKATLLRDMKKPKIALNYSKRALQIKPDDPNNLLLHIDLLLLTANVEPAVPLAEKLWARHQNATSARMLGLVRLGERKPKEAIKLLETAAKSGADPLLINALSNAYQLNGQPEKSIQLLSNRLKQSPNEFNTRFLLATVYQTSGKHPQAIKEYELLREQQPKNPIIWNNLAWLFQQTKDSRSLDHAREALRLAPDRPDVKDTLGWILLELGEIDEALPLLQAAAVELPKVDEIQFHYATALVRKGMTDKARTVLDPLLENEGPFKTKAQSLLNQISSR